jgi:hypothetical protein
MAINPTYLRMRFTRIHTWDENLSVDLSKKETQSLAYAKDFLYLPTLIELILDLCFGYKLGKAKAIILLEAWKFSWEFAVSKDSDSVTPDALLKTACLYLTLLTSVLRDNVRI